MLFSRPVERYLLLQSILLLALYIIYVTGGYKLFTIWSQIDYVAGANPLKNLNHTHGLRYLMVWPAISIAEYFEWNRDVVFSYLVSLNLMATLLLTTWLQTRISYRIEKRFLPWLYFFLPILIVLSFPMNGRLSYMFLGTTVMMAAYARWLTLALSGASIMTVIPSMAMVAFSIACLSVSSGCFTVGMLVALSQTFIFPVLSPNLRKSLSHCLLNFLVLTPFFYLQYKFMVKGLDFFGGSIFSMLTHGPGKILISLNPDKYIIALIAALLCGVVIIGAHYLSGFIKKTPVFVTPALLIFFSIGLGSLGYSVLLTGSIAAMIFAAHLAAMAIFEDRHPVAIVRDALTEAYEPQPVSRTRKFIAVTCGLLTGLMLAYILPDDWAIYDRSAKNEVFKDKLLVGWGSDEQTTYFYGSIEPYKIIRDHAGNMYVVDMHTRILRISQDKKIEVFAGSLEAGDKTGPVLEARFKEISDLAFDKDGKLYVADYGNNKVFRISNGMVEKIAGNGDIGMLADGCGASNCRVNRPKSVSVLDNGEILISSGSRILVVDNKGNMHPYLRVEELSGRKLVNEDLQDN